MDLEDAGADADTGPSIRDALSGAMEAAEAPADAPAPTEAPAPETKAAETETPGGDKPEGSAKARDESGRFSKAGRAPAPTAAKPELAGKPTESAPPPAATAAPSIKAPQSWKPAAREEWAKVPPVVQEEITRRDREIATTLQQSAAERQGFSRFREAVAPYEAMIRAEGGDVMATVGSLLQTAAALRTAPPAHKGALVARMIDQFGIPLEAINAAFEGKAPPAQPQAFDANALTQQIESRLMQRFAQQRGEALQSKAVEAIESFAPTAEFLDDVRDDMADILEMAARRGLSLTPQAAYDRACALHPDVSKVLAQRQAASQANAATASTQRAKAAASSIRSQPTGGVAAPQADDVRSALDAAWSRHTGR